MVDWPTVAATVAVFVPVETVVVLVILKAMRAEMRQAQAKGVQELRATIYKELRDGGEVDNALFEAQKRIAQRGVGAVVLDVASALRQMAKGEP